MLITEKFVFLHPPKTGGAFVTEVLSGIYAGQCNHWILEFEKHGTTDDIPEEYRAKQIVTIVRNPFDYYASHYRFGYWINRDVEPIVSWWDEAEMRNRYHSYPYLTFQEFVEGALDIGHKHLFEKRGPADALRLGPLSVNTLKFSVPDYVAVLEKLRFDRDLTALRRSLSHVRFLHTESLNQDVHRWLIELGVPHNIAEPILTKARVQPLNTPNGATLERGHGQPRNDHWSELFDEQTTASVVEREWLFFALFPEYRDFGSHSSTTTHAVPEAPPHS